MDKPTTVGILKALFGTYAFYNDRPSRRAVQRCLISICKTGDKDVLTPLIGAIRQEAQKNGIAASNAFVLVEWCSLLIENLVGTPLWDTFGDDILLADATVLEKCLRTDSKHGLGKSALVATRRGFRKLVSLEESREKNLERAVQSLSAKGTQPTAKNAIILGVIAGVCARKPEVKPILVKLKSNYFSFYTREIVGSRTPVPEHLAGGLSDFFTSFVTLEELDKEILPAIEKGLLRAPEVVLDDLITPLVHSLPEELDLSQALNGRLLKPLLSSVKSSNQAIRNGAANAFKEIVTGCRDFTALEKVADEILAPLKTGKLASADHRIIHSDMLASLPMSGAIASKIATGLPAVTAKEGNEAALASETLALHKSALDLLPSDVEVPKAFLDAYVKGLADKKVPVKRTWILRTGEILYEFSKDASGSLSSNIIKFAEATLPPLVDIFNEVNGNPLAASQSGVITGALVLSGVGSLLQLSDSKGLNALAKKAAIQKSSLTIEPKPSFLLNPRIYAKFSDEDLRWFYRSLSAVAPALGSATEPARIGWAQAFLYILCSSATSHTVRKEALDSLADLYVRSGQADEATDGYSIVARTIIAGIWHWIQSIETAEKESAALAAKTGNDDLSLALKAICLSPTDYAARHLSGKESDRSQLQAQMCSLLVLAHPDLIPRVNWIDLCLKVGLDPGELAQKHEQQLISEIVARTGLNQKVRSLLPPPPHLRTLTT